MSVALPACLGTRSVMQTRLPPQLAPAEKQLHSAGPGVSMGRDCPASPRVRRRRSGTVPATVARSESVRPSDVDCRRALTSAGPMARRSGTRPFQSAVCEPICQASLAMAAVPVWGQRCAIMANKQDRLDVRGPLPLPH